MLASSHIEMTTKTFEKEIIPLKHPIFRYAYYMLKNMQDAQDVTQEVLIKIWKKKEEVPSIKNIRAWTITITRNTCLDFIKSKKGESFSWDDNMDAPTRTNPFEELRLNDESNWIKILMNQLPVNQKDVFYLRHFEGNSYKEIGETLKLDESKVKVYLHRARKTIKKSLEEKHSYGLKTG